MKVKTTFVTNSSSASFTILKHHLNDLQIQLIYDHLEVAYLVTQTGQHNGRTVHYINDPIFGHQAFRYDEWQIDEDENVIHGDTTMDNFDMFWFLTQVLKIKEEHIYYDHAN